MSLRESLTFGPWHVRLQSDIISWSYSFDDERPHTQRSRPADLASQHDLGIGL